MQHFMTYPTNSSAVCGADMVGQRNSRWDITAAVTTCRDCKSTTAWKEAVAGEILEDKESFDADRFEYNATHFVALPTISGYATGNRI